ncbi:HAD-IA family hydrolase [Salinactinospora qingdaonensis]|uniref:Haloacid dehalogenase superfamily, subfamily IA, variant 3 with third motif having DD or ED n=1 Tax=Salinactinospora qingdaonensis TaxID=702744 RepID=A0ABP7G225_9ACTN
MTIAVTPVAAQTKIEARENELIGELTDELHATIEEEVTEGGSPARLLRLSMPDGTRQVLKLQVEMPGAVDGHDLESFRVKLRQIDKLRADAPRLGEVYTEKLREFHGGDWSAYTMPYYPNEDIAACIRGQEPRAGEFFDRFDVIMSALAERGWRLSKSRSEPGQISEIHSDRLKRRFWLLDRHLAGEFTDRDRLVVNGVPCRHPLQIADILKERPELTHHIDATRLYFPAHGDLNTRNLLITGKNGDQPMIRIIDPRGTLQNWDIVYDWGKVLFDLDGVLVESGPVIEQMWRGWALRRGLPPADVLALTPGRRAPDVVRLAAPHLDADAEADGLETEQVADLHLLEEVAGAQTLTRRLDPGSWAVVTSGSRFVATTRLEAVGIPLPSVLVTADDVVRGKPDPEGYLTAAKELGVAPTECVVVEDAAGGVQAALAAGMRVVGVAGSGLGADDGVEFLVADLSQLQVERLPDGAMVLGLRR